MHLNQQKEQFSLAYIHAVAAIAGYQLELPVFDRASVDGRLLSDAEIIEFQAKATSQDIERNRTWHFRLPVNNHEDLRSTRAMADRLLIVVKMPESPNDWGRWTDDEMCLESRGRWLSLRGERRASVIDNVTVELPPENRFDPAALTELMQRARDRAL